MHESKNYELFDLYFYLIFHFQNLQSGHPFTLRRMRAPRPFEVYKYRSSTGDALDKRGKIARRERKREKEKLGERERQTDR